MFDCKCVKNALLSEGKTGSGENKTSAGEASSTQQQAGRRRTTSTPATGFPTNPFDFSAMQNLLNVIIFFYRWCNEISKLKLHLYIK